MEGERSRVIAVAHIAVIAVIFVLPGMLIPLTIAFFPIALISRRMGGPGPVPGRPGGQQ